MSLPFDLLKFTKAPRLYCENKQLQEMSSSREFPRPPIVLTLTSSASYYAWNKQLQELATDAGVHLHLGFQPNDRPRMPKMYADTANKISNGQALNERERKEASDHSKSLQIYQKDTALGLKLLKSTVDEEVFQQIKTNIPNYSKPSTSKLKDILKFLHDELGGVHSDIQDERSNRDLEAIPNFTSRAIFSSAMSKLDDLKEERAKWGLIYAWRDTALILWFKKRLVLEKMSSFLYNLDPGLTFDNIRATTTTYFKTMATSDLMKASRLTETKNTEIVVTDAYAGAAYAISPQNRTTGYGGDVECFGCGGKGHTQRECPNPVLSPEWARNR